MSLLYLSRSKSWMIGWKSQWSNQQWVHLSFGWLRDHQNLIPLITFKFDLTEFEFQLTNLANASSLGRIPRLKAFKESHGFSQHGVMKRLVTEAAFERRAHFVITFIQATGLQPDSKTKNGIIRQQKSLNFKLRNMLKPRIKPNNGVKIKIWPENDLTEGQNLRYRFWKPDCVPINPGLLSLNWEKWNPIHLLRTAAVSCLLRRKSSSILTSRRRHPAKVTSGFIRKADLCEAAALKILNKSGSIKIVPVISVFSKKVVCPWGSLLPCPPHGNGGVRFHKRAICARCTTSASC